MSLYRRKDSPFWWAKLPQIRDESRAATAEHWDYRSKHGQTIAIGNATSASAWKIVQVESTVSRDIVVTLRALTSYGVLPEIDELRMPIDTAGPVRHALERAGNSAFRESPISVIDQCRDAAQVVLSRWLVASGAEASVLSRDLGQTVNAAEKAKSEHEAVRWAASIVNRLHPRGNANEQLAKRLRHPEQQDAEFAVYALGFIVREVGWAKG